MFPGSDCVMTPPIPVVEAGPDFALLVPEPSMVATVRTPALVLAQQEAQAVSPPYSLFPFSDHDLQNSLVTLAFSQYIQNKVTH